MDEEFLKLLEEMANVPDFPHEPEKPESFLDASTATANQKAEQLADYATNTSFKKDTVMPAYLKSQIINRVHQPDIQRIVNNPTPKKPISKQLELFFYSCKVAGAVAAAFAIMITASATKQWIQENDNKLSDNPFTLTNPAPGDQPGSSDTKSEKTDTDRNTIRITESFSKGSSAFTSWLQNISNLLVNGSNDELDT